MTCCIRGLINLNMKQPRALTHDEKKAAEAAFLGRPFHESWSKSARVVYDGVLAARGDTGQDGEFSDESPNHSHPVAVPAGEFPSESPTLLPVAQPDPESAEVLSHQIALRREAIEAGLLIDVTKMAKGVGFNMAVGTSSREQSSGGLSRGAFTSSLAVLITHHLQY